MRVYVSPACSSRLNPRKAGILRVSTKVGTAARWAENRPLSSKRRRNPEAANAVPGLMRKAQANSAAETIMKAA